MQWVDTLVMSVERSSNIQDLSSIIGTFTGALTDAHLAAKYSAEGGIWSDTLTRANMAVQPTGSPLGHPDPVAQVQAKEVG